MSENPYQAPSLEKAVATFATRRRWYHLRLSTIVILVLIAAWACSCQPQFTVTTFSVGDTSDPPLSQLPWSNPAALFENTAVAFNPLLIWPLLTLAAFLTWKIGWAIAGRRKRNREATCTQS